MQGFEPSSKRGRTLRPPELPGEFMKSESCLFCSASHVVGRGDGTILSAPPVGG